MILLILIAMVGVYIGLFVLNEYKSKSAQQRWAWRVILLFPVIYLTWDIPVGYVAFKSACAREGGLKVYKQPEPADTLRLANGFDELTAAGLLKRFPSLKQVEAQRISGVGDFRLYTRGNDGAIVVAQNELLPRTNAIGAEFTAIKNVIAEDEYKKLPFRLGRRRSVLKGANDQIFATFTKFYTAWSDDSNTLFGRAIGVSYCHFDAMPADELTKLIVRDESK